MLDQANNRTSTTVQLRETKKYGWPQRSGAYAAFCCKTVDVEIVSSDVYCQENSLCIVQIVFILHEEDDRSDAEGVQFVFP